jgi:hypothetical protein
MKSVLDFNKNLKEESERLLKFEEFSHEVLKHSYSRVLLEEKIFFTFISKQKMSEDSLKNIPAEISKLKFELISDLGKLEQYAKLKDKLTLVNYENIKSLLNSEKVFILNLEEYLQFIFSKSKLSDENIFRKCESSYFEIHSKVITLDRFDDIKKDIDDEQLKAKEINDDYLSQIHELNNLKILSILGIFVSSISMIFLIIATIKYNLFKENISQECGKGEQSSRKKACFFAQT